MNERMQGRQQIVAQSRLIDERIDGQNKPWRVQRNGGIEYANGNGKNIFPACQANAKCELT